MTVFEDRKKQFEEQFRHEQDLHFRITARANRMFGEWAAARLDLTGAEADDYAEAVVHAQFDKPDVVAKVHADFQAKGVPTTERELRSQLASLKRSARRQVMTA
ncbi:DUF1476 domain-containing protein [Enhydrobacter sp.]|jgi:hypothetical protein|uniref:DUF1476 domain-containing protein n=1 Tax=Enhydrobacter sp. TaxID=1894999 RepID=UPI002624A192|nr:DUF1476 domain-containing protein [Enhydrobacter sp.]WIM12977.1 MAG: hypothetical protein OJF58_003941 [Enhydrobacter sp.]